MQPTIFTVEPDQNCVQKQSDIIVLQNEKLVVDEFLEKVAAASRGVSYSTYSNTACVCFSSSGCKLVFMLAWHR